MGSWCSLVLDDGTRCTPPIADIPVLFLVCVIAVILCSLVRKGCKAYCGFRRNIVVPRNVIVHSGGSCTGHECEVPPNIIVRADRCSMPCDECDDRVVIAVPCDECEL